MNGLECPPLPTGECAKPHGYAMPMKRRAHRKKVCATFAGRNDFARGPPPRPRPLNLGRDGIVVLHVIEDDECGPRITVFSSTDTTAGRSEERRVGKECRSRWS